MGVGDTGLNSRGSKCLALLEQPGGHCGWSPEREGAGSGDMVGGQQEARQGPGESGGVWEREPASLFSLLFFVFKLKLL